MVIEIASGAKEARNPWGLMSSLSAHKQNTFYKHVYRGDQVIDYVFYLLLTRM